MNSLLYVWMVISLKNVRIYGSIVKSKIFQEFTSQRGHTLFNHSSNSNFIEDFIAAAYVLCPDIIDVEGHVFIADFFNSIGNQNDNPQEKLELLKMQHGNDKKKVEQWVNACSFGDFFIGKYCESMENEKLLIQFGDILVYFWSKRLNELFPERSFVVDYGEGLAGEEGFAITFYES